MSEADHGDKGPVGGTHAAAGGDQAQLGARENAKGPSSADLPVSGATIEDGQQDLLPMAAPEPTRRGPGKPKGAVNIRTNQTFQVAVSRYGDPLIGSIAIGNMQTKELITWLRTLASDCGLKLGATVMDVVRFQEECRRNAMPYGHAKRAAVDEQGSPVVPVIGLGTVIQHADRVEVRGHSIEDRIAAEAKTIQGVSETTNE